MLLTKSYLESANPITSVEQFKAILDDNLGISVCSIYFTNKQTNKHESSFNNKDIRPL